MRRLRAWGWGAILSLGLAVPLAVAGEEEAEVTSLPPRGGRHDGNLRTLFHRLSTTKPPANRRPAAPLKNVVEKNEKAEAEKAAAAARQTALDEAAAERSHEEAALLRRLAVCNKLMQVAAQTNDKELQRQAEDLDERAWRVYSERTSHLPGSGAAFESEGLPAKKALPSPAGPKVAKHGKAPVEKEEMP